MTRSFEATNDRAIPVLIDCDPGMDDALALILALKSPLLRVVGISAVSGNLPAARCYQNIHTVLQLMDRGDIPTAQGAAVALSRELAHDPFSHGEDGLGETGLVPAPIPVHPAYAPSFIVEQARAAAKAGQPLTLLALGPLTNIALALMEEPQLPQLVDRLIVIAGAFGLQRESALNATGGNPVSEWNVYVDPEAARRVFHAGFALTAVGLDVATHNDLCLLPEDEARLRASSLPEARQVVGMLDYVLGRGFHSYCVLIDSCAVVAAAQPVLIETVRLHCDVDTQSELTRGMTVTDVRDNFRWRELPLIEAASDADFPRLREFILSNLLANRQANRQAE